MPERGVHAGGRVFEFGTPLAQLMFGGGAMSDATMAALCMFNLAERLLPAGTWVSRLPGVVMTGSGTWLLAKQ